MNLSGPGKGRKNSYRPGGEEVIENTSFDICFSFMFPTSEFDQQSIRYSSYPGIMIITYHQQYNIWNKINI